MNFLISTDLDGTLLDHHDYSWDAAMPAIQVCFERGIPIIFNTSKTYAEANVLQGKIGISGNLIVENGSAMFVDVDSLKPQSMTENAFMDILDSQKDAPDLNIEGNQIECVFGKPREQLLDFIDEIRQKHGWRFEGFNDWDVDQVIAKTGLTQQGAMDALSKSYSEPFEWQDSDENLQRFIQLTEQSKLKVLKGGRFYHLQGMTNKAVPLLWLKHVLNELDSLSRVPDAIPASDDSTVKLICLGDNHNDVDMLNIADFPVCVRSPVAKFPKLKNNSNVIYTELEGPKGWNKAVLDILTISE